jgi:hypothetical protein
MYSKLIVQGPSKRMDKHEAAEDKPDIPLRQAAIDRHKFIRHPSGLVSHTLICGCPYKAIFYLNIADLLGSK